MITVRDVPVLVFAFTDLVPTWRTRVRESVFVLELEDFGETDKLFNGRSNSKSYR